MEVLFYYGLVCCLQWDLNRIYWKDHSPLLDYSTKKRRALLRNTHSPPQVALRKWDLILLGDFKFQWATIWDTRRVRIEADLLWRISHKALAVNQWRGCISPVDMRCHVCLTGEDETIPQRFWGCLQSLVFY